MASSYTYSIISTQIQRLKMRIEELPLKSHNIVAHALGLTCSISEPLSGPTGGF